MLKIFSRLWERHQAQVRKYQYLELKAKPSLYLVTQLFFATFISVMLYPELVTGLSLYTKAVSQSEPPYWWRVLYALPLLLMGFVWIFAVHAAAAHGRAWMDKLLTPKKPKARFKLPPRQTPRRRGHHKEG